MSSAALTGRAALVSPGAALAPLDTQARAEHLQERIGLLARLGFTLAAFFLVTSSVHRLVFFGQGPLANGALDLPLALHLGLMSLQAAVWSSTRRKAWTPSWLPFIDAGLVLLTLCTQAVQLWHLQLSRVHHLHLMMIVATLCILMCRATIVPSKPRTTLLIGCAAALPVLVMAYLDGHARGVAGETVSFSAVWCIAAVAITTFTSKVIYGLRETVTLAQQLGQYVIEKKLGEGGMGEVYLARHTLLRRPTAIKLLPPERAGEKTVARFEREVRATSRLSHPNTVAIYDYGRTREGVFYYAMEHLDGLDLQRLVQEHGPLPPERVVHILLQIAGALSEAHARGLVHRDLKPANVFLCERGGQRDTVKVLDFGLVKETGSDQSGPAQTDVDALVGTPTYLPPEAIHSPSAVDSRSDLYAVGAIGYFLLTGRDVFQGSSVVALCIAHLHEKPVRPSERLKRELPADLEALIMTCLEKSPEGRPQSAAALRRSLLACNLPSWSPEDAETWWASSVPVAC
jgi:serine/threonine-protein kinase